MTYAAMTTAPLATLTLRDKKWYYKGEGNANVVLAVPEDGTVVRVMKDDSGDGTTVSSNMAQTLTVRVAFCDVVRRLFFGDDYVDVPVPMRVRAQELREIGERVQQDRPPNRRHKGLERTGGLVAVYPDYTTTTTTTRRPQPTTGTRYRVYCAEIKPKRGWLHEADRAGRTNAAAKCAFCAHQYLKLSRGDVREISRYCPLDLFSGRRERVERAVRELLRTPQNNLKMFADGVPLAADDLARAADEALGDRFCAFVASALLGDFSGNDGARTAPIASGTEDGPCDFDAAPMPRHCVLHKVLTMQKMQTASFAAVCAAYERLPRDVRATQQFGHVDRLLLLLRSVPANGADGVIVPNPVDGYLVAATAHDCSVYVTFCRTTDGGGQFYDGRRYAVAVKVSDLDPKPLSTVDKHRKRNADVLLALDRCTRRTNV